MPEPAHSAEASSPDDVWWRTFPDGYVGPVDVRNEPRPGDLAFQPGASLENPEPLDLPGIVDLRDTAPSPDATGHLSHQTMGMTEMTSSPQTSDSQQPAATGEPQPPLPTVNQPQASSLIAALVRSSPAGDQPDARPSAAPVSPEVPEAYRYSQDYSQQRQTYQGQPQTYSPQVQAHSQQGYPTPQQQTYPTGYGQDRPTQAAGYPAPQPQTYPAGYGVESTADAPTATWNGYEPAFDRAARPSGYPAAPTAVHSSWRAALGEATRDLPRGTVKGLLGALVGLAVLGTVIFVVLDRSGKPATTFTTSASKSASVSPSAAGVLGAAVPAASIKATASSTGARDGAVTYVAANTLDGKPTTAWNSAGGSTGVTLTFTFAEPVHLGGVTMLDGYQKSSKSVGDLWAANSRAKTVTVDSDTGSWTWDLSDTKDLQTLSQDLGTTSKVTLTIEDVYPGSKYEDIAISELSFLTAG